MSNITATWKHEGGNKYHCSDCGTIFFFSPTDVPAECPACGAGMDGTTYKAPQMVNHPAHYNAYNGIEVIDLVEQMQFNRGNAVKYICRAGLKSKETEIQDLEKAAWYINREVNRLKGLASRDLV